MGISVGSTLLFGGEKEQAVMPSLHSFATLQQLTECLKSTEGIKRFPPCTDRQAWNNFAKGELQKKYAEYIISKAKEYKNTSWPECTLKLFTQYIREGNRANYEKPYIERRYRLTILTLAECLENKGEYIEDIAEGLWTIYSEPTWVLPAHERFKAPDPVPLKGKYESVDLFASQTALMITAVIELLEKQLTAYSPSLIDRLKKDIIQRVIEPLETDQEAPWWIKKDSQLVNNWIPWCCSNSFGAAQYVLRDDPERLAKLVWKMHTVVDKFIASYKNDGACDEGPTYWTPSVGQMYRFMDQLNRRTNGLYEDFFKQPKIRRMGEFITDLNLTGQYFMNYSDAASRILNMSPGLVYSFGESIDSTLMKSFITDYIRTSDINGMTNSQAIRSLSIMDFLMLMRLPEETDKIQFNHRDLSYFADRNIFIARHNPAASQKGIIGCIKGGHNNEGHNHNDVTHFSVYVNGKPLIVDTGAGVYTRKTFSHERYTIWWIGGMGHNAPQINGHYQLAGEQYHAKVKEFNPDPAVPSITYDISKIYDKKAEVSNASRKFTVDRKKGAVYVADSITMKNNKNAKVEIKLFTPQKVVSFSKNQIKWQDAEMNLKNIICSNVSEVDLEGDSKFIGEWGKLYSITLTTELKNSGNYDIEIIAK